MKSQLTALLALGLLAACQKAPEKPKSSALPPAEVTASGQPIDLGSEANQTPADELVLPVNEDPNPEKTKPLVNPHLAPALKAAYQGPELRGFALYGKKWTIKPAIVETLSDRTVISGELVEWIPYSPGEKIKYEFVFQKEELISHNIQHGTGGWTPFAAPILSLLGRYAGLPLPQELIIDILSQLEQAIQDDDEGLQAEKLATALALEMYQTSQNP